MPPTTPSSHKPRRKQRVHNAPLPHQPKSLDQTAVIAKARRPPFPLALFLWPTRGGFSQWAVLPLILAIVGLYRWATTFWGYSGFQSPPMHGDFEAQRHWMEITTHLPVSQWYFHDLEWWGLDYPPLTAYHSLLLGKIGLLFEPSWFELYKSRGLDDPDLKLFMRATVVLSEYIVYIPALIMFVRRFARAQQITKWEGNLALAAILMQPGTILIDHAHFQYNTVMLGLVAASAAATLSGSFVRSSVYFVAALGFKQMALYYAPAMFAFLLGSCLVPKINLSRFMIIATTTIISFGLVFGPIILAAQYESYKGLSMKGLPLPPMLATMNIDPKSIFYPLVLQLAQSIHRIFPFARGLFEDKVANVWCAVHTFHKLHKYPQELLQRAALGATLLSILPSTLAIGSYPSPTLLPWALASTAWGFFLFSFQVHEKSVLLPLLPMTLLLSSDGGLLPADRSWITWANVLGCWTMYPLLKRDELTIPYFVLTLLWAYIMGAHSMLFPSKTDSVAVSIWVRLLHGGFYAVMLIWHFLEAFSPPIDGKPDIWVVINVLIGAAGFGLCYLWCTWRLLSELGAVWAAAKRRKEKGKQKAL